MPLRASHSGQRQKRSLVLLMSASCGDQFRQHEHGFPESHGLAIASDYRIFRGGITDAVSVLGVAADSHALRRSFLRLRWTSPQASRPRARCRADRYSARPFWRKFAIGAARKIRSIDHKSVLAGFVCRSDCDELDRRTEMATRSLAPETAACVL